MVAVLVAASVAAGAIWWSFAAQDPAPATNGALDPPLAANPVATSFAVAASASEAAVPVVVPGVEDEMQLCGGGWIKLGPDGKPSGAELLSFSLEAADRVATAAIATMSASPSPAAQAAAHYFLAGRAALAASTRTGCDSDTCVRIVDAWKAAGEGHREALARLAQLSDDAQVYAWAYRSCKAVPTGAPGACMQIAAAQWARLDAGNAEPWLALAEEARGRKDEVALDDAMFHVAAAERHRSGRAALAAALVDHAPQDDASLIGMQMAIVQAVAVESIDSTAWQGSVGYCSAKAVSEPNRRETCERIATLLADRSTTLIARSIGLGMGKRLGWSAERLDALIEQRDAEAEVTRLRSSDPAESDPAACTPMRAGIGRLRETAELGEIEIGRRDLAASGRPVARLAADHRRWFEAQRRPFAAEQAASAVAAASAATTVR